MDLLELQNVTGSRRELKDKRSAYMKAKTSAKLGVKVIPCPFNCPPQSTNDHGVCKHVVGYTDFPGTLQQLQELAQQGKQTYEPLVRRGGAYQVQVPKKGSGEFELDDDNKEVEIMVPNPPPCEPDDKFVRITTSWIVFRESGNKHKADPKIPLKKKRAE